MDRGYVLIDGRKAPYIGNISMNASTVDLTDIPGAKIGDNVTILGKDKKRKIDINELALYSGTIAAELMIFFGRGISRMYHSKNKEFSTTTRITQGSSPDIIVHYYKTVTDLPGWLDFSDIVSFLEDHTAPFNDPIETVISALDYALSSHSHGGGFVLLAILDKNLVGAAICVRMDKVEFVPANLITYLCVHPRHRRKGLGTKLLKQVIEKTEGDIKIHMHASNPALKLFQKMGFDIRYLEMRLKKWRKK
jgi:GNAT superfamily N-acetyltransferase